ncbi:type II toxin-antitoxin system RelE/ParE family toxin [Treponema sp.]|uniref:type II toxin-antitoxin system RelE/ParE family toxin n=1 Tax=Treponema sp. TaxID=166 RepID=UPI00298E4A7D|nr:type II toxin-antitoxin system RelE/ParE family toxin [Treponema sp.]MCR5612674.1 type II toxin-antitoxin system RelE/ParE family toxin [Treponema sp.]
MENEKIEEIIVSEFAEEDLNEIADYYFSRSPDYVERIISEFEENVMSLQKHPRSGRVVPELERQGITQYRELIQEYYRIIYEISGKKVIVHTIIDGRRNFEDAIISKLSRNYGSKK